MGAADSSLFRDGIPVWPCQGGDPNRFQGLTPVLESKLFRMPQGALISFVIWFKEKPQGESLYSGFTLADPSNLEYLTAAQRSGKIMLVLKDDAGAQERVISLGLSSKLLKEEIEQGRAYDSKLARVDPAQSANEFLRLYTRHVGEPEGWRKGWLEVEKSLPPPPAPKRSVENGLKVAAGLLSPFLVVASLSYLFAGRGVWIGALVVLGIIGAVAFFRSIKSIFAGPDRLEKLLIGLYGGAIWCVIFFVGHIFGIADIYIDNYSNEDVRIELDGKPWIEANRETTHETTLRKGTYTWVIFSRADNRELDRKTVRIDRAAPHVLNVLGAMTYYKGTVYYGLAFAPPDASQTLSDVWFLADVSHVFEDPPDTVEVKKGTSSTSRTYIKRIGKKPNR